MSASKLERLFALHQGGALTEAEYLSAKARLLTTETTSPEGLPTRPSTSLPRLQLNKSRTIMFSLSLIVGLSLFLPWHILGNFFSYQEVWSEIIRPRRPTSLVIASTGFTAAMILSPMLPGRRLRAVLALLTSLASLPLSAATYTLFPPAFFLHFGWAPFLDAVSKVGAGSITFVLASFGIQAVAMWELVPRSSPECFFDWRSHRVGIRQVAGLLLLYGIAALSQRFLVEVVRTGSFFS